MPPLTAVADHPTGIQNISQQAAKPPHQFITAILERFEARGFYESVVVRAEPERYAVPAQG